MNKDQKAEIERMIKNLGSLQNDLEIAFTDKDLPGMEDIAAELMDEGKLLLNIATGH